MWKRLIGRALLISFWGGCGGLLGVAAIAWAIDDAGRERVAGQALDVAAIVLAVVWIGVCIAAIRFFWPEVSK